MSTKRFFIILFPLALVIFIFLVGRTYFSLKSDSSILQNKSSLNLTQTNTNQINPKVIDELQVWAPEIQWHDVSTTTMDDGKGNPIPGLSRSGTGISPEFLVPEIPPEINQELLKLGWRLSNQADAPGGSSYHYTIFKEGKEQIIDIYYKTKSPVISKEGEPIQFGKCPCPYEITISTSDLN